MTIVQLDKMSASTSRERALRLYDKNIELENKRKKAAQAQVPLNPSAWQQIRDNYEAIILEDHGFSEERNIEYTLWQLHYRRIEELRAHLNAALKPASTNASQSGKVSARPDRVMKIRLQFKTFLSEATGFYHDLIVKIRAKYGLPLGYLSEESDTRVVMDKDGKGNADLKKGLISCHRCLIYLGDLARYKGLYGSGDSKTREHAAALSYYQQASSLWPSSGNPYHQLAILATYSGDELVAIYWYFRSLAVDYPFVTARDNLIVAFDKNRQSYMLLGDNKDTTLKESSAHLTGKGKGKGKAKGEVKPTFADAKLEGATLVEKTTSIHEIRRIFSIRFVRLNGILFTRTSLEAFPEVLSSASSEFLELLSSGLEEEMNFGADAVENALFILRLVCILIVTVHNTKRESEGLSYAEIIQHAVLLQNAFLAIFKFMGHILERSIQLGDPSSSYLLPGILVFVEWLACRPDIASGNDAEGNQVGAMRNFWHQYISFLNKILLLSPTSSDGMEDEMCFNNMTRYEDGETENRCALWEDFEVRGFVPLVPAQTILDFSRKPSFRNDGNKEKSARVKRIIAAGKALVNTIRVDDKTVYFNSKIKKFIIGCEPQISEDARFGINSNMPKGDLVQEIQPILNVHLHKPQEYVEGEEDDEVIVFKPTGTEKYNDLPHHKGSMSNHNASLGSLQHLGGGSISAPFENLWQPAACDPTQMPVSTSAIFPQKQSFHNPPSSNSLMEGADYVANMLKNVRFAENGHISENELQKNLAAVSNFATLAPVRQSVDASAPSGFYNQTKMREAPALPRADMPPSSMVVHEQIAVKSSTALQEEGRKMPVSRPVRHLGPPPGFDSIPLKQERAPVSNLNFASEYPLTDDYSWLDGYQVPSSKNDSVLNSSVSSASQSIPWNFSSSNGFPGAVNFPFPGKQEGPMHYQVEKQKELQNYQTHEHLRAPQEQQLIDGNRQVSDQYHGQSIWSGHYIK